MVERRRSASRVALRSRRLDRRRLGFAAVLCRRDLSARSLTHEWGWRELLVPQALRGFAQQFAVAPAVTLTLGGLAPERLKLASGLFNLMRTLAARSGSPAAGRC